MRTRTGLTSVRRRFAHRAAMIAIVASACRDAAPPLEREFDGAAALRDVATQVGFGPRVPNTDGHRRQAAWMDSVLRARADTVIVQNWNHRTAGGDTLALTNLIARFRPDVPTRILFLAHWDTRPYSDGPNAKVRNVPVPGANDGGSGVAVLLGVASLLKRTPPGVGVDLLFVDGEDYGDFNKEPSDVLIGSRYYAAHQVAGPKPSYAVLFDMVGDSDLRIAPEPNSTIAAPDVMEMIWAVAKRAGHQRIFVEGQGTALTDDHIELQKAGIRAVDIVDFQYPWWHTGEDTLDKVSAASLAAVGDVAIGLIRTARPRP
ncbi:MAG: M28 family peptidase [Gemmatimonadales bacterium]|nr:M28 family peptidase [Gemmatimonadales bacterium]